MTVSKAKHDHSGILDLKNQFSQLGTRARPGVFHPARVERRSPALLVVPGELEVITLVRHPTLDSTDATPHESSHERSAPITGRSASMRAAASVTRNRPPRRSITVRVRGTARYWITWSARPSRDGARGPARAHGPAGRQRRRRRVSRERRRAPRHWPDRALERRLLHAVTESTAVQGGAIAPIRKAATLSKVRTSTSERSPVARGPAWHSTASR